MNHCGITSLCRNGVKVLKGFKTKPTA